MALQIISKSFRDDQNRNLSFLHANSLDYITATYRVYPIFKVTFGVSLQVVKVGQMFTLTSGSWEDYGFTAGASIAYQFDTHTGIQTINYINGADLVFNGSFSFADQTFTVGSCQAIQSIEGANISFNLIKNSDQDTPLSLIDGEPTRFTVDQLQSLAIGSTANMVQLTKKSGMSQMTASIVKTNKTTNPEDGFYIDFRIGFFLSPWLDADAFLSGECVKPYIEIDILPQYANPNVKISATNSYLGNTGFVSESYNGGVQNFIKDYIIWKDVTNTVIDTLDYTQTSKFEAKILGDFTGSSKFQFKLFWELDDILNLNTDHSVNTIATVNVSSLSANVTIANFDSAVHFSGAKYTVEQLYFDTTTAGYVKVTGQIVPNTAFTSLIEARNELERGYRLWIRCEDPALDYNSSDAMNVDVDSRNSVKATTPLGAYPLYDNDIIGHDGSSLGADAMIIEDDIMRRYIMRLPKNDRLNYAKLSVIVKHNTNGQYFALDEFLLNFANVPMLANGTMPINFNSSRGYKLTTAETDRYTIKAYRIGSLDNSTEYGLQIQYPFLLRWEYWLSQLNADNDFYGNQNKLWTNYIGDPDWNVYTRLELNFNVGSYINDDQIVIRPYDDWTGTSSITFERLDGTALTGLLADEICVIKATHTKVVAGTLTGYCDITIEPFENSPRYQITSEYNFTGLPNSPLIPLAGQTKATFEVSGNTVVSRCLFDPSKLPNISKVKLTSRVNID